MIERTVHVVDVEERRLELSETASGNTPRTANAAAAAVVRQLEELYPAPRYRVYVGRGRGRERVR